MAHFFIISRSITASVSPTFLMATSGMAMLPVQPVFMPMIIAATIFAVAEFVMLFAFFAIIALAVAALFAIFLAYAFFAMALFATASFVIPIFGKGSGKCRE